MVSGRDGPYYRPYLGDAQPKGINVILTPWAMTRALGLTRFPPQHESLALFERVKKCYRLEHTKTDGVGGISAEMEGG